MTPWLSHPLSVGLSGEADMQINMFPFLPSGAEHLSGVGGGGQVFIEWSRTVTSLRAEEQTEGPITSEESGKAPEEVALNPALQEALDRDGAERGFLASMALAWKAGLPGAWRRLECPLRSHTGRSPDAFQHQGSLESSLVPACAWGWWGC